MKHECLREQDVIDAIASRKLPDRLEEDLRAHVKQCTLCRDTAEVALAMSVDHDDAWSEAAVPTADIVWFRAQMRARAEAARVASRPMVIVAAIGLACALGVFAGVIGSIVWWLRSWAVWLSNVAEIVANAPTSLDMMGLAVRGILLAVSVWLVLAPVAVYLAATDD